MKQQDRNNQESSRRPESVFVDRGLLREWLNTRAVTLADTANEFMKSADKGNVFDIATDWARPRQWARDTDFLKPLIETTAAPTEMNEVSADVDNDKLDLVRDPGFAEINMSLDAMIASGDDIEPRDIFEDSTEIDNAIQISDARSQVRELFERAA